MTKSNLTDTSFGDSSTTISMNCKVLIDIEDTSSSPGNQNSKANIFSKRGESSGHIFLNLLTYIRRLVLSRRLKLLKLYMAAIVIIALLFLTFELTASHSKPDKLELENDESKKETFSKQLVGQTKRYGDLPFAKQSRVQPAVSVRDEPTFATDPNLMLNGEAVYPNNLSHLLAARDFAQMTNLNIMQIRIRDAAKHSWDNYRRYAWGYDMLKPRSKEADHWFQLGLTIVDSVDTLIMMGLPHETNLAIDWIENELNFTTSSENSNCFELTIRILAGILSTYHLTGRDKLKQQAKEFGDVLLHCYDSESRVIPYSDIDLRTHRGHPPQWNPQSSLSEVTSLQLEFRYLSQITNDPTYEETTFKTSEHIHNLTRDRPRKLLPMYISPTSGQLEDSVITLGARADSYYEYLLKQYLQTGIKWFETDYLDCVDEIQATLLKHTGGVKNYTYVAEMFVYKTINNTDDIKYYNKMDHLVCFLPGTLALGYYHFSPLANEYRLKYHHETPVTKLNSRYDGHLDLAKALARTCYHMYSDMGTGLAPEIATFVHPENNPVKESPEHFEEPYELQATSAHNILRPEYVETLFYLYHITGLPAYRHQAEKIFNAFQEFSKIPSGYTPVSDVRTRPKTKEHISEMLHHYAPDRMESFWLSETLKYFYLIFCDDKQIVGTLLNHYVFNTEAHIIPIL